MTGETLLLRQVHPNFIQADFVSSQAFRPTPKDESRSSVSDGDQITAEAAYIGYVAVRKLASVGVVAVTVEKCAAEGLPARPNPLPDDPTHAVIDYTGLSKGQCETKGKRLKAKAEARGWLHRL